MQEYCLFYNPPIGILHISTSATCVLSIRWVDAGVIDNSVVSSLPLNVRVLHKQIILSLDDYFRFRHASQKIACCPCGTPFQQKIWDFLIQIPFGSVMTYGEIAKKLQTSSRAVGQACRRNKISIFIPCHRVVAKTGLGGFFGRAQGNRDIKHWLLQHEMVFS